MFLDALLLRNLWCQTYKIRLHQWFLTANYIIQIYKCIYEYVCAKEALFLWRYIYISLHYIYVYVLLIFPCFKCIISCKLRWGIPLRLCVDKTQTWRLTMLSFLLLNFLMHFWGVNNVHFYNIFLFLSKFYDWYNVNGSI